MLTRTKRFGATLFAAALLAVGVSAPTASAHPTLIEVTITNLDILNNNEVTLIVRDVNAAVNICAAVDVISQRTGDTDVTCTIDQQ